MYAKTLQGILDKLSSVLKHENLSADLLKIMFLLIKVLYLRMSRVEFDYIWKNIWPDLMIIITKYLKNKQISFTFEVLKFLDFMIAVGFDNNYMIGLFLFDVPEFDITNEETSGFIPLIGQHFLSGYSARPCQIVRKELIFTKIKEKKLIFAGKQAESEEDLDILAKSLLQFASFYCSENVLTDWNGIEEELGYEISSLGVYE
jgi:hypothetical protein